MYLRFIFSLLIAKILTGFLSPRGGGSALPGLVALKIFPSILIRYSNTFSQGIILVSGTNGKTTTATLIKTILENSGFICVHNATGSNLERGIASSLIGASNIIGGLHADWGVFEVDEAALPRLIEVFTPKMVILLDLFRDQLDRYGEIDSLADNWKASLKKLPSTSSVLLNADDPVICNLGLELVASVYYFGINDLRLTDTTLSQSADSIYCPVCRTELQYKNVWYSHLGNWACPKCTFKRPELTLAVSKIRIKPTVALSATYNDKTYEINTPLEGLYSAENVAAAILSSVLLKTPPDVIKKSIARFKAVFGRHELFTIGDKKIKILLSKNPTGFTQSLITLDGLPKKNILFLLNDRVADGTDVSWIYDVEFERLHSHAKYMTVSGDRCLDLAVRLKYADIPPDIIDVQPLLKKAFTSALFHTSSNETLYILATYTAMLDIRKLLIGNKLL